MPRNEVEQVIALTRLSSRNEALRAALLDNPIVVAQQMKTTSRVAQIVARSARSPEETPEYSWWH